MQTLTSLLTLVDAYCQASGLAEATVSSRLFNDGKRLGEVRRGADIGVQRVERAVRWLHEHWPDGFPWPNGISTPDDWAQSEFCRGSPPTSAEAGASES
ncbi:hypothetical protein H4S14_000783 [Agrobacterium vitis]|nr:hypothetical protein [Agrobacterium vitis]MBE1437056.1 hypothetical protein [Agrobacterium vitis]